MEGRGEHEQGEAVRERGDSEVPRYKLGLGKSTRAMGPWMPHVKDIEFLSKVPGGLGFSYERRRENL